MFCLYILCLVRAIAQEKDSRQHSKTLGAGIITWSTRVYRSLALTFFSVCFMQSLYYHIDYTKGSKIKVFSAESSFFEDMAHYDVCIIV
jgi:hypothetical protein